MIYIFDTDMVSFFMRDNPKNVRINVIKHSDDNLCISTITYAELIFGLKKNFSKQLEYWLSEVVEKFNIISFDSAAALTYGDIRAKLEKSGTPLDNMDMLIASCAVSSGAVLVSHNKKHFSTIKGLKIEDWSAKQ